AVLTFVLLMSGLTPFLSGCMDDSVLYSPVPAPRDAEAFDADPFVTDWFETLARGAQQTPEFVDPFAARAFAYVSIALHESLRQGYDEETESITRVLNNGRPFPPSDTTQRYHWLVVANSAVAGVATHLFRHAPPEVRARISEREAFVYEGFAGRFSESATLRRSVDYGKNLAKAVIAYADADGIGTYEKDPFATEFTPTQDPSCWHPGNDGGKALLSSWGSMRPFLLTSSEVGTVLDPGPFPAFSTAHGSTFFTTAMESYTRYANLRPDDRAAIDFWGSKSSSAGSLSAHMVGIAAQMMRGQMYSVRFASDLLLRLTLGMADASIAAYKAKYAYPLLRPSVYIAQHINPSTKPDAVIDKLVVPPCPEYCSTTMAMSEAACAAFAVSFAGDVKISDKWRGAGYPVERGYVGFASVLAEIRNAQMGCGLQYAFSVEAGSKTGTAVARLHAARLRL
ncbi:MAG: hypothetical protein ACKOAG_10295, partial [Candidatus Kapaibacterium sp.]